MDDIKPKFLCPSCHRGVLNRSAERCLFCGAKLPAGVRLSLEEISARETADERAGEKQRQDRVQPHSPSQSGSLDGFSDAIDLFGDLL
jgi:hypothetical protein